jgi:hypothetical protein
LCVEGEVKVSNEIEILSDGSGLVVMGQPGDVEAFLTANGMEAESAAQSLVPAVLDVALKGLQLASSLSADSGRWVKLTKESAEAMKKFGLMDTSTPGIKHAMVGKPGEIKQWIQIVKSPASVAGNPAFLTGAAGAMAQLAMQQQLKEIAEYLARIEEKVDDVLRAQTNQVLARMDGVSLALREADVVRVATGRVSDVTWSKVQGASSAILETQGYALRQLADLADKVERAAKMDAIYDTVKDAEANVQKWLTVLARCFQLHDEIGVLELERVLVTAPEELDSHRLGLRAARDERMELISRATSAILARLASAAERANSKVLLNPARSPEVVAASNRVAVDVQRFHDVLGIELIGESAEARLWREAASESWESAREVGASGVDAAKGLGQGALRQASAARNRLSQKLSERSTRSSETEADA